MNRELQFWVVLILVLCGGVVWVRTATVKTTYLYVQKQKELAALGHEIQTLRIQWLKLTAPERLEGLAPRFDLVPTHPTQRVRHRAGQAGVLN